MELTSWNDLKYFIISKLPKIYSDGVYRQHEKNGITEEDKMLICDTLTKYLVNKEDEYWENLYNYGKNCTLGSRYIMEELGKHISNTLQIKAQTQINIKEIFNNASSLYMALSKQTHKILSEDAYANYDKLGFFVKIYIWGEGYVPVYIKDETERVKRYRLMKTLKNRVEGKYDNFD